MALLAPSPGVRRPPLPRNHPIARRVARVWRELTGGGRGRDGERRTLVACSGGADSGALVLALAAAVPGASPLVVAHVVHDLRPRAEALADRDAAKGLAEALGLPFVEAEVCVKERRGNPEAVARQFRYRALARLAAQTKCGYIATAHHADDQLETVLMALVRGSGPRGLAGIAAAKRLGTATVIRPMLAIARKDAERLCLDAAWTWREDATNRDRSRLRNALRHDVLPAIRRIRPEAARHAVEAARLLADAADLVRDAARAVPASAGADGMAWTRQALRAQSAAVLGELLRLAARQLLHGSRRDRLGLKRLGPAIRHIRGPGTDPRSFVWSGLVLDVTARTVALRRSTPGP